MSTIKNNTLLWCHFWLKCWTSRGHPLVDTNVQGVAGSNSSFVTILFALTTLKKQQD